MGSLHVLPMKMTVNSAASYRLLLASRVTAAIFGGYALASGATVFLSAVLPLTRAEAVLAATLASFAIYTAAIIWAFAVRSVAQVWWGMLGSAAVLGGVGLLLARGGL